ncbi:DUF4259 domain-containing protein [Actinomadura kijaniata]|uniref:DUF4259 domain-containing protein n=1 Tax=Actinomadura kijaniata TaxID=46161 RepID=UPI003F1C50CE
MGTWGNGPFDDDTAMDFFDELADCDAEVCAERVRAAILRLSRAQGHVEFTAAIQAVAAAALLAGVRPTPTDPQHGVAPLPPGMLAELAADAAAAVERAHSPQSELWELWSESGGYDRAWRELAPVLRTLRAATEQDALF